MAEVVGQRDEIAFGIDDDLLHPWRALLQQPAQQMRFARAGIALHQQAGGQQFLEVEQGGRAALGDAHVDIGFHSIQRRLGPMAPKALPVSMHRSKMGKNARSRPQPMSASVHRASMEHRCCKKIALFQRESLIPRLAFPLCFRSDYTSGR